MLVLEDVVTAYGQIIALKGVSLRVDAGDVVVHVFRPEARSFYALEKMWTLEDEAAAKPVKTTKPTRKVAVKKAAAKPAARRKRAP